MHVNFGWRHSFFSRVNSLIDLILYINKLFIHKNSNIFLGIFCFTSINV